MADRMRSGAEKIIRQCLGLRAGESVAIVVDYPNLSVGQILADVAEAEGGEVSLLCMPERKAHAEDPPRPIAQAMQSADVAVLATVFSLSNSEARRQANRAGTRLLSLPGCRESTLVSGAIAADFEALKEIVQKVGRMLSEGRNLRIETELGTNLELRLCGRKSVDQTAMALTPGSWAPAPLVETAVAPDLNGAEGTLVVDGVVIPGGVPDQPVTVEIKAGRIISISGGRDADRLRSLLAAFKSDAMYQLVEFGIGLNPESRMGMGIMAEDESQFGTVHFGFGEGRTFGVDVVAPSHVDLVIRRPRVRLDGVEILADERLILDISEDSGNA